MIVILDASTLFNLANGETFGTILKLPQKRFMVSKVVRGESRTIADAIDEAVELGHLGLVDDSLISVKQFSEARHRLQLDAGETECILAAAAMGCSVACDDQAARKAIIRELGETRLTGSIGLLKIAVGARAITSTEAFKAYELMRSRGGFLPARTAHAFCC